MVISAAFGWDLMSFDVETAFLNGIALARELYCWPPNDVKGIDPKKLWRLKKGVCLWADRSTPTLVAANSRRLAGLWLDRSQSRRRDLHLEGPTG
jgi:hypothetical protein